MNKLFRTIVKITSISTCLREDKKDIKCLDKTTCTLILILTCIFLGPGFFFLSFLLPFRQAMQVSTYSYSKMNSLMKPNHVHFTYTYKDVQLYYRQLPFIRKNLNSPTHTSSISDRTNTLLIHTCIICL